MVFALRWQRNCAVRVACGWIESRGSWPLMEAELERGASFGSVSHGGSMHPFIRDGDSITLAPVRAAPGVGDVVAVLHHPWELLLVHRVVERRIGAGVVTFPTSLDPVSMMPSSPSGSHMA